jgi:hypothetical protein
MEVSAQLFQVYSMDMNKSSMVTTRIFEVMPQNLIYIYICVCGGGGGGGGRAKWVL